MSRELVRKISGLVSEAESHARLLRYPSGVMAGLEAAQRSLAHQLDQIDKAEREGRPR